MRPCWRSPAEILKATASSYHEDRWVLQDVRVVVVLEKAALAGIIEPVCKDLDTPLLAARGYSSARKAAEAVPMSMPLGDAGVEVAVG
jgi:hypothetical protein